MLLIEKIIKLAMMRKLNINYLLFNFLLIY